jgi:PAS domain S-box-containing protein
MPRSVSPDPLEAPGDFGRLSGTFGVPKAEPQPRTLWIPLLVLLVGVVLTLAGVAASRASLERSRQARFQAEAETVRDALEERLHAYEETLAGARAFAVAERSLDAGIWREFSRSLALSTRPGIVRLGYAQWVEARERAAFEGVWRRSNPRFAIRPAGVRERYLPVLYFEPTEDGRESSLGFDLASSPERGEAIERSRRLDRAALSERVELLQGGSGIVMFLPVRPAVGPEGVVYASLRMADLVRGVAPGAAARLDVELFDGPDPGVADLLYDGRASTPPASGALQALLPIARAGRTLGVRLTARQGFDGGAASREPWLVLAAGLLVSTLGAAIAWSAASTWARAHQLAARFARDASRNEERVRTVVDNVAEGIVTFDTGGAIRWANAAAERLFGSAGTTLVGRSIEELVPVARGDLRDGFRNEAFGRRADGALFPVELSVSQMRAEDQPLFVAVVRDATERREVERMKDEFVSTVSHELRTPLTSIRGSLGLLRSGVLGELPADAAEAVAIAERNSERLLSLINDILDVERLRAGRFELSRAPVAAGALVAAAIDSIRPVADSRGVRIETAVLEAVVDGDRRRLGQVLVNLLSNAVKFSPEGERVRLEAGPEGEAVVFRVIDRGRGVPPEHQAAIFERFRQVEASDSRERGGSGLGLAICKALVERHGGTIGVDSVPGAGSTFWFRVPRAAEEQA